MLRLVKKLFNNFDDGCLDQILTLKGSSSVESSINECFTGKNAMNWKVVGVISGEKT